MQCDEERRISPPVELARSSLIDGSLERTVQQDQAGATVEVYSTKPISADQVEASMNFILRRLLGTEVGAGSDRSGLDAREIRLEYFSPVTRQPDYDVLTHGYRLNICSPYRELSEADIEVLRDAAFRAASDLISGDSTAAPYGDSPDQQIARQIHKKLMATRIRQPFVFNASAGRVIEFTGYFGGEEEVNGPAVLTWLDGFINSVVYRAQTLSFAFEGLGGGRAVKVEYNARFRDAVHNHAGPEPSQVTICCEERLSRNAAGKVVKTYMLESIGKVFDYRDWQAADDDEDAELAA